MTLIYCAYTNQLPWYPKKAPYPVVLQYCQGDHDYETGLKTIWRASTDLVIVEHDMCVTDKHIEELSACPYILCAYAYFVYPVTTGEREPRIAHAKRVNDEYIYLTEGEEWADHAAFGCIKLGRLARKEVTYWDRQAGDCAGSWRNLDTRVSGAFFDRSMPFHIHWPVIEHAHQ